MIQQKYIGLLLLVMLTGALEDSRLLAQSFSPDNNFAYVPGVVRVKFNEQAAQRLEKVPFKSFLRGQAQTGLTTLNQLTWMKSVRKMRRVFRPVPDPNLEAKHQRYGLHRWYELVFPKEQNIDAVLASLSTLSEVEIVEKRCKVQHNETKRTTIETYTAVVNPFDLNVLPNDPRLDEQWHYRNIGQGGGTPGADISLEDAWTIETGSAEVVVAVLDHGIRVTHEDLRDNMWVNIDEIPDNGLDDDGNGYVDDIHGYGFVNYTPTIIPGDHGTHVAGTIAANTNNGLGVAGVAGGTGSGDGVKVISCVNFAEGNIGNFEEAFVYAADNGAVIAQNSWGYVESNYVEQSVLDAIDYFIAAAGKDAFGRQVGPMNGGIVIFAAGNDGIEKIQYPASYPPTLAVASTDRKDRKSSFSNYGTWVDISAPGNAVLSTRSGNDHHYGRKDGTSFSCPHVSGVAALLVSKFGGPGFAPDMLRNLLVNYTDNIYGQNPNYTGKLGSGRLNAYRALLAGYQSCIPYIHLTEADEDQLNDALEVQYVSAADSIAVENVVLDHTDIYFQAGETMVFKPGFQVVNGSSFQAFITSCTQETASSRHNVQARPRSTLYIEEVSVKKLGVYPNPNDGAFSVKIPKIFLEGGYLILYNAQGEAILNREINDLDEIEIMLPSPQRGIYFIQLMNQKGEIYKGKVIIL